MARTHSSLSQSLLSPCCHGSHMFFFPPIMALTEQIGAIKDDESEARLIPPPLLLVYVFPPINAEFWWLIRRG
jgi:hypothetical protein